MRRIAAHYLIDCGEVIPRPLLSIAPSGEIAAVEQWERLDATPSTEFYAGALTAGWVNAHCHSELSYLKGRIERGSGFAGFARAIGAVRGDYTPQLRAQALAAADASMWQQGVEMVADIVNDDSSFEIKSRSKIEYHSFAEMFGLCTDGKAAKALTRFERCSLTPHSTYSLQSGSFAEAVAGDGSMEGAPLSIHFMESDDELQLFRGEGSLAAWYEKMGWECDFLHYGSPSRRIVGQVPNHRRVMLVHACCATEEDMEIIEEHFTTPPAWVVCPQSNAFISSLRPPIELLRKRGARLCVGTDSLASNDNLSMVEELKLLSEVPLAELVSWVTINGALALGREAEKGSIATGKRCGVVLLEGISHDERRELRLTPSTTARRLV